VRIKDAKLKRLHVNGALLRKGGEAIKPITIKHAGKTLRASVVTIDGPSVFIYSPDRPLGSGAVLWIETNAEVGYA
jgi:hypothetical protein